MTDLTESDEDIVGAPAGDTAPGDDAAPERITEIGAPELIDKEPHPWAAVIGLGLLVLVVLLGLFGVSRVLGDASDQREVEQVVVPRLSNRPLEQARTQLERLGLIVDVRLQPNEVVPPNVVVEQTPIAGARLEVGERVVLGVSDGPAGVRVPDLIGQSVPEAQRLLGVLGLSARVVEAYDELVPTGAIVSTNPEPAGRSSADGVVELVVSLGPEPRVVPDVVGKPSTEAMLMIGSSDLTVGDVTRRYERGKEAGTVLTVSPAGGTRAPRGQPLDVVIASATPVGVVPDLVGLRRRSAESIADELGITLKVTIQAVSPGDRRNGLVIEQRPIANSPLAAMTVVVAAVPAPTTTTTTTPGAATTTTEP